MPKKLNLLGQKFGRLIVIDTAPNIGKRTYWLCQCECGNIKTIQTDSLRNGRTQSCGCLQKEIATESCKSKIIDLTGKKFGKLIVIQQAESYRGHSAWLCQCDCGNIKIVNSVELRNGDTLSCGCLRSSFAEQEIAQIFDINNIKYQKEYSFQDLISENGNKLKFDFAIFENNKLQSLVEYDGEQHYLDKTNDFWSDTLEQRQKRDILKNQYCLNNNIPLYRIPYWEKNNLSLDLIFSKKYLIS